MADLIVDDTLVAYFLDPGNSVSSGRQLLNRVYAPGAGGELSPHDKLLRQLQRQNHECGGFRHPTIGMAAAFLRLLRDPDKREDFLQDFLRTSARARIDDDVHEDATKIGGTQHGSLENIHSDESMARAMAVDWMIGGMVLLRDAEVNKLFDQFSHERRKAQTLYMLGTDYEEDARRHIWEAVDYLKAAGSADNIVRYAGWSLEKNFSLKAPRLVARLVTHAVPLRPKMTERQARYLCGWERRALKDRR